MTSQSPPYTALLRAGNLARADCTQDAQKSTARSSPHCAHPSSYTRSEGRFSASDDILSIIPKAAANEPKLLASPFNRHRWHTLELLTKLTVFLMY